MRYLLDVNALLALLFVRHEFHDRVERWIASEKQSDGLVLATCPLTELGFVRIASGVALFGMDVAGAKSLLGRFKKNKVVRTTFLPDSLDTEQLPSWVKKSAHVTDGYLKALAEKNTCVLATLDEGIPQAFLIPR
jgi:predicted nucleic acid-binding protein